MLGGNSTAHMPGDDCDGHDDDEEDIDDYGDNNDDDDKNCNYDDAMNAVGWEPISSAHLPSPRSFSSVAGIGSPGEDDDDECHCDGDGDDDCDED